MIDELRRSDCVVHTIDISNLGPTRAFNVIASDLLPADVSFVSSSDGDWLCSHAAGVVDCTWDGGNPLGTLAADQAADTVYLGRWPLELGNLSCAIVWPNQKVDDATLASTPEEPEHFLLPRSQAGVDIFYASTRFFRGTCI